MSDNLPRGWQWMTIKDIAAPERFSLVGNTFGLRLKASEYTNAGVPIIRGVNLAGQSKWNNEGTIFVTEEKADDLISQNAIAEDVIFTQQGTVGQVGIIPPDTGYERWVVSQSQMKLRTNREIIYPLYVYFYFRNPIVVEKLQSLAVVTGVPHINLGILRTFPILVPTLEDQEAILDVLGSLDDKIELNRRMNATLEATARALFKSWFVDFDPVRAKAEGRDPDGMDAATAALFPASFEESELGLIPSGWEITPLDQIAYYENGLALQKYPPIDDKYLPVLKIRELRQGFTDPNSDIASPHIKTSCIVEDGDVIFSWSGSLMIDVWCGGRSALNQHLFKVTSEKYPKWFFYYWTLQHLEEFISIAANKATTMGHIQRHHISEALTIVPDETVLAALEEIIEPIFSAIIQNRLQSRTLAATRDALLPKLMSGEIRVGEVEI